VQWRTVSAQALTDFVRHEATTKHGGGRQLPGSATPAFPHHSRVIE